MLKHEKKAFWKFFTLYFGSVALLILTSGFFYFEEQKKSMIEKEHFSMIEYVRKFKMKLPLPKTDSITHKILEIKLENFNMNNFKIEDNKFLKYMPYSWDGGYILVQKDKSEYHKNLLNIKLIIITVQILLLFIFAILSYFLSIAALKPMQEAISKLDNFSKDLIHDLNTPITSILLNMKLLDKNRDFQENKPLSRIKKSVDDISELHNNLTILLQEETMLIQNENISKIVDELTSTYHKIYPDIKFTIDLNEFYADVNKKALKQVLSNLISNACKYNKQNGFIKIYRDKNILFIQDNGIGIKNLTEVFNRSYKEHNSGHGIGLDIVKRLCDAMEIEIGINSQVGEGTIISLTF